MNEQMNIQLKVKGRKMQSLFLLSNLIVNILYVICLECTPSLVRVGTAFPNPMKSSWWVLSKL